MGRGDDIKARVKEEFDRLRAKETDDAGTWSSRNMPTFAAAGAGIAGAGLGFVRKGIGFFALHGRSGTWLLAILAFAINYFHIRRGFVTFSPLDPVFLTYILFAFLAAFFYKDSRDVFPFRSLLKFLLFSVLAYYWPLLITFARGALPAYGQLFNLLLLFAPLWLFYIFLNPGDGITRFLAFWFYMAWMLYIIFVIFTSAIDDAPSYTANLPSVGQLWADTRAAIAQVAGNVKGGTVGTIDEIRRGFNGSLSYATQEYYTGTVDQQQGAPLGVFITDVRPYLLKHYAEYDPVAASATMKARSLSDSITIDNDCYLQVPVTTGITQTLTNVSGAVTPETLRVDYSGEFQDIFDLECIVPNDSWKSVVPAGRTTTGTLFFNSSFDFETLGYATISFMDRDLFVSLRRDNIDPALALDVPNRITPKYTPGPAMIGMPSDSQPYSYERGQEHVPSFGVTLSSAWQGKGHFTDITKVEFYIPRPFTIDGSQCTPQQGTQSFNFLNLGGRSLSVSYGGGQAWDENPAYRVYTIEGLSVRPGESFVTVRCPLEIDRTEERTYPVVGPGGAGVFTFFAFAEYGYEIETRSSVTLVGEQVSS